MNKKPEPKEIKSMQELASVLLKGDLSNLAKKVKAGKPLNVSERNLLQSAAIGDNPAQTEYVNSIVELAEVLGVTRKTVQRWRGLPDCPKPRPDGRWHVPEWRTFKMQHQGDYDEGDGEEINQAQAKARQILLQNERLEMKILVEKKELIPKIIAQQIYSRLILAAKNRCFASVSRFVTLARTAENAIDAGEEIRKEMILIWKAMEEGEWQK